MRVMVITTMSGSVYTIRQATTGIWRMLGENVVTERSKDIRAVDGLEHGWEVEFGSVPKIGEPLCVLAPARLAMDDPTRIPGGGKITSPITNIEYTEH